MRSSSSVPGTVDAALPIQQPAANAAAAATGVSLPVSDGQKPNSQTSAMNGTQQHSQHTHASQAGASYNSPSGDVQQQQHHHNSQPQSHHTAIGMPSASPLCPVCGAVQSPGTKHCYIDGRCVPGFDHHCVYLNTCVGERNYHLFFLFVSCVTALLLFQLFVTLWLLAHYRHDDYRQAVDTSRLQHPLAWLILLTCVAVLPFLALLSIASLQCFHCFLVSRGLTTYQFIVRRRQTVEQRWQTQQQQQWAAQGRAAGADGPVLSEKQRLEQAEWMKERARQRNGKQHTAGGQEQHLHEHMNGAQPAGPPQLNEEIRSV